MYNTSWESRVRVTLEGFNSDIKSDNVRSFLVANNNMTNIKQHVLNTIFTVFKINYKIYTKCNIYKQLEMNTTSKNMNYVMQK